jgi:hypothetical protein
MTTIIPNMTGIQLLTWEADEGEVEFNSPLPIVGWLYNGKWATPISTEPTDDEYALLMPSDEVILPEVAVLKSVKEFEDFIRREARSEAAFEAKYKAREAAEGNPTFL